MEFDALRESFIPPKFIGWREACERLEKIRRYLRESLEKRTALEILPARCFYIALLGEMLVLRVINDNELKICCPVPWYEDLGFVSLPTFSADAGKAPEFVGENKALKAVLKSFIGWQVFSKEVKEGCACGMNMWKTRDVSYEVLVNHAAVSGAGGVLIKQFFAIRSEDVKFRDEHFNNKNGRLKHPSNVLADANIIWVAENQIVFGENGVKISGAEPECAKEIYDHSKPGDSFSCGEKIFGLTKEMEEIYERSK